MTGKASLPKTPIDDTVRADKERKKQFGRERANFSKVSLSDTTGMGYNFATNKSKSGGALGEFLPLAGGRPMIGPIAFNAQSLQISNGIIDVGASGFGFSSRIVITGDSIPDDLVTITGANNDGQILFLQVTNGHTVVLKQHTGTSTGGNINIPGGSDFTVSSQDIVLLQWDSFNDAHSTYGGQWTLVSSSSSSSSGATRELDNLQNVAINSDLLFGTTGLDLGNTTNPVDRLYANTVRLQTGTPPTNIVSIGASANDGIMKFGVPTNKWYQWGFGSTPQATYLQEATPQLTIKNPNTVGILLWDTSGNDNEFKIVNQDSNSSTRFSQDYHAAFEFHGNTSASDVGATRMYLMGDGGINNTFLEFSTSQDTANADIAKINFEGHDSAGNDTIYATIGAKVYSPTSGAEGGILSLEVVENGTERTPYLLCDGVFDKVKIYKPLDMSSQKITNLSTPANDYDAATKKYVDDNSGGGGGSGANTTLSNLGTTALNAALNMNGQNIQGNGTLTIKAQSSGGGEINYNASTHDFEGGSLEDINQITAKSSGTRYINNFKGIDFDGSIANIKVDGSSVFSLGSNITYQQAIYSSGNKEIYLGGSSHVNFGYGNGSSRPTWKSGYTSDSSLPSSPEGKVQIRVGSSTKYVYYYSS